MLTAEPSPGAFARNAKDTMERSPSGVTGLPKAVAFGAPTETPRSGVKGVPAPGLP
jgi:hypothetical protein